MGRGRGQGWGLAVLAAVALVAAVGFGARAARSGVVVDGAFDGVGAVIALVSLAVALVAARHSAQALRWQETNLQEVAARLAVAVLDETRTARQQLLGDHDRTVDVRFVLCPAPAHTAAGAGADGRLGGVVDYYRDLRPRRLVVTGAPGAGKTVLALQLMLHLLLRRTPDDPVPVLLSLASWDPDEDLGEWIARRLRDTYRLPAASARELVRARLVLPVLDGLDEMDADSMPGYASRAGRAVRALNRYQDADGKAGLVLTCRTRAYTVLEGLRGVWAQDAARVEIRPVDAAGAGGFLRARAADPGRWQPVIDELERAPDGPLARGLSTPWRLTLASLVHEPRDERTGAYLRDPAELLAPELDTAEAVSEHLLGLLVPTATATADALSGTRRRARYTPGQVRAWLTELAVHLDRNAATGRTVGGWPLSGTDIVLHELWPLAGSRLPRAVHTALLAAAWLLCAAALLPRATAKPGFLPVQLAVGGMFSLLACSSLFAAWVVVMPQPDRMGLRRFRTPADRRRTAKWLGLGGMCGMAAGGAAGIATGDVLSGPAEGVLWLATGGGMGFGGVLVFLLVVPGAVGGGDPRDVMRDNLVLGAVFGGVFGLVTGGGAPIVPGGVDPQDGERWFEAGLVCVPAFTLVIGLLYGPAGARYASLLLCTRRWNRHRLPWRLGRFLHWCYGAGLLRLAGTAYQFRHRELQDHLASRVRTP
ncbi:NACHT domain-containing protein [Streptomyces nanhaiensis]|uniref:NACHT domain-containing protein n=1 Tax=Streptomyces nanhaiensis TaxID=679319 RepID=UPI00399CF6E1